MDVSIDTIFGVRVGFEFIPTDMAQELLHEEARGGLLLDLFIVSIMFVW